MTHRIAAIALLPALLAAPALAQDVSPLDQVAAVFIGFAEGATVELGADVIGTAKRLGPGHFIAEGGVDLEFTITEPTPCVFEVQMDFNTVPFHIAFDLNKATAITFSDPQPKAAHVRYRVEMTGEDGMAQRIEPDGTRSNAGNGSPVGTSIPLAELEADAAALLARCEGTVE